MIAESQVTIKAARHLATNGWKIESIALPRGGSGIVFHAAGDDGKKMVPDIVASRLEGQAVLMIESKPDFSNSDLRKLLLLKTSKFRESIERVLGYYPRQILIGMAFGGVMPKGAENLPLEVVLHVSAIGEIQVFSDTTKTLGDSE